MVNTDTLVSYDELVRAAADAALAGQNVAFVSAREPANGDALEAIVREIQPTNCTRVARSQYRRSVATIMGGRVSFVVATRDAGRGWDIDLLCLHDPEGYREGALDSLLLAAHRGRVLRSEAR
ncbi:hypothetical protein BIZ71_gp04 [Gordonia phage Hedwig]|uniref:Uncharacterized protein n=1 Tax=Gordonia phage Hedwig TaxID=1887648 RepID=A0A1C9EHN3_9CAUD|nr:hypothetical protein BIZ71_gp04 [Gordonia phage Hedwig]AON97297.1 hypothetical protein SEA_HEDWIG_4 [Gordonia phage Hedwig]